MSVALTSILSAPDTDDGNETVAFGVLSKPAPWGSEFVHSDAFSVARAFWFSPPGTECDRWARPAGGLSTLSATIRLG